MRGAEADFLLSGLQRDAEVCIATIPEHRQPHKSTNVLTPTSEDCASCSSLNRTCAPEPYADDVVIRNEVAAIVPREF